MQKFLEDHPEIEKVVVRIKPYRSYSTAPFKQPKNGIDWELVLNQGGWDIPEVPCNHPNCQGTVDIQHLIENSVRRKVSKIHENYFQCTVGQNFSLCKGNSCPTAFSVDAKIIFRA